MTENICGTIKQKNAIYYVSKPHIYQSKCSIFPEENYLGSYRQVKINQFPICVNIANR